MGTRGPRKQPAEVKEQRGSRRPSRDPAPVAERYGIPACPFGDKTPEAAAWELIVESMIQTGTHIVLTRGDFGALEAAATALARARQASEKVAAIPVDERMVFTKSNGLMPHGWLREEKAAWAQWRMFAADLGLSPTARNNVTAAKAAGATPGDDDPLMGKLLTLVPQPMDDPEPKPTPKARRPKPKAKPTAPRKRRTAAAPPVPTTAKKPPAPPRASRAKKK